jgi:hypothetical protein
VADHDEVDGAIELPVAAAVEPMPPDLAGRGRDGRHAGKGGEGRL